MITSIVFKIWLKYTAKCTDKHLWYIKYTVISIGTCRVFEYL